MLPLYDASLDNQIFNIFKPLDKILPYDLPKLTTETPSSLIKTDDTYCKPCKKKFNNQTTFVQHLKSAKHIANEKKSKPTNKPTQTIPVHPQVQEALHQLDLADTSSDPTLAINTYWTQAQFLYQHKRPEYTSRALRSLIDLLCLNPTTSLSPAYMTFYLYNSRLALARLLCMYQQVQEAQDIYLDALETKWKLDKPSLINIAKHTRQHTVEALLASCESLAIKYLTRERNRTKPAPPLTDMNNAFSVILNEGGNLFAQETGMDLSEPIAIVLYGLGSLVCPFENRMRPQDFHCLMQSVYTSLGLIHRQIEVKLLDKQDPWCLFDAFLTSLEIDDLVRASHIQSYFVDPIYPDVKLLLAIYQHRLTLEPLLSQLNHIELLLHHTNQPLLIRSQPKETQVEVLTRLSAFFYLQK